MGVKSSHRFLIFATAIMSPILAALFVTHMPEAVHALWVSYSAPQTAYEDSYPDTFVFADRMKDLQEGEIFEARPNNTECYVHVIVRGLDRAPRDYVPPSPSAGCIEPGGFASSVSSTVNGNSAPQCAGGSYMACIEPPIEALTTNSDDISVIVRHFPDYQGLGACCSPNSCQLPNWPPIMTVKAEYEGNLDVEVHGRAEAHSGIGVNVDTVKTGMDVTWAAVDALGYSSAPANISILGISFPLPWNNASLGTRRTPLQKVSGKKSGSANCLEETITVKWDVRNRHAVFYPWSAIGSVFGATLVPSTSVSNYTPTDAKIHLYFSDENIAFEADIDTIIDDCFWF